MDDDDLRYDWNLTDIIFYEMKATDWKRFESLIQYQRFKCRENEHFSNFEDYKSNLSYKVL